jgi:hypothetical protein
VAAARIDFDSLVLDAEVMPGDHVLMFERIR